MSRVLAAFASGFLMVALIPVAQSATEQRPAQPEQLRSNDSAEVLVAATKTYKLLNVLPFPVDIKIHGDGPSFPQVVRVPAAPAPPVPIPYPNLSMQIQIKKPGGGWTSKFTLNWKPGNILLPSF